MTEMTDTERATVERFDMAEAAPESWRSSEIVTDRPVGDGDGQDGLRERYAWCDRADRELRDALAAALQPIVQVGMRPDAVADALLPVVTAWAEQRARERAAEELEGAAAVNWADTIRWAEVRLDLRRRAAEMACTCPDIGAANWKTPHERECPALAADDRTGQR